MLSLKNDLQLLLFESEDPGSRRGVKTFSVDLQKKLRKALIIIHYDRNKLTHWPCPVSNNGFLPVRFGSVRYMVTVLLIAWLGLGVFCCVLFIRNCEFERRSPSVFDKQIIRDLVSCVVVTYITYRQLILVEIWK